MTMGFTREDAEASALACGHNLDACMVWIVSHMEEKQYLHDLNQASIESELSKRAEEKELKVQEHETLKRAKAFTALFTTVRLAVRMYWPYRSVVSHVLTD